MEYKIIVNPVAGKGRGAVVARALPDVLTQQGVSFDMVVTKRAGDGIELAREAVCKGWPAVVSVGGDGTMNEVLQGIAGSNAAMGIIPAGTGNDLAHTLNISLDWQQAVTQMLTGEERRIDLGRDRDGYFAILVGMGFPADVMTNVNTYSSLFKGPLAIAAGIVKTIGSLRPWPMQITIDEQLVTMPVAAAFVLNTRFTGGGLQVTPEAQPDDGLLDICLMADMGRLELLRLLPSVYHGGHVGHPKVHIFRGKRVKIEVDAPLPKVFDGNVFGQAPIDAELLPGALKILAPKGV